METKTIPSQDPQLEESFSISTCCDFNSSSSLAIFSDNDQTDHDDDESYIEIALEPAANVGPDDGCAGTGREDCYDHEMKLRISFTSGVFLPAETKTTELYESPTSYTSSLSSTSSSVLDFSSSSAEAESQRNQHVESKLGNSRMRKTVRSKVQFPTVNHIVDTFTSSFRESSEIDLGDGRSPDANHLDLGAGSDSTRKPSKITTPATINNGTVMKLLTIFRPLKLRTLLASFLKVFQEKSSINKGKIREETLWSYNQSLTKPVMERGSVERKQAEKSGVLELNLDSIRGVLEAMSIRNIGRRERSTKDCPGSSKSSPFHQRFPAESYNISSAATDKSIQAAIAHCKRSFGPDV